MQKTGYEQGTKKNHKFKAGAYYDYLVIAIVVDPLQKCVRKIRSCSLGKQGKKQGTNWEKS